MPRQDPAEQIPALNAEFAGTPYSFLAAIGQGGMGAVYEVEHRTLKRRLVIKILREVNRPDLEDRLRLEAQALAQLAHPNLLAVVDYAHTQSGRPYLVSERLHGQTLKEKLGHTGSLSVVDGVRFASQALAGLAVAHRVGVVHRDVKLDNIFLCDGDELTPPHVKVIDFGIAKLVGAEGDRASIQVEPLAIPTAEGVTIGTPSFMSPEQVMNMNVDQRADIYGIGAVLYRLLAGRNVFICKDFIEFAAAHASEVPSPPSRFAPIPLPDGLDAVILRALEKRPGDRYQTAKEMIDALAPFTRGGALEPTIPRDSSPQNAPGLMNSAESGLADQTDVMARPPMEGSSAMPVVSVPAAVDTAAAPVVSARAKRSPIEVVAIAVAVISAVAILYFALVLLKVVG